MVSSRDTPAHVVAMKKLNGHLVEIVDELVTRGVPLALARREFEKLYVSSALAAHDGNIGRAADALGVHRNTLRNKVQDLGVKAGR